MLELERDGVQGLDRPLRRAAHRREVGLEPVDAHLALAGLQHFLARAVALHFGRWRIDAHQLERDAKRRPVVEADLDLLRLLVHGERCRAWFVGHAAV